jgi:phthalate 4,5-dioxygenase oxygenase subunit
MMNAADNALLTRVEGGAPMGAMLREYWIPACRSAKLVADGAPEKVRLFGENLVAFRVTDGRVGLMQEGCPHRCASLALARNEDNGLRCIFHGWKFSVEGECVDAPTEPAAQRARFAATVPVRAYPTHEAGGLVWAYMGAAATPPRFPAYEFTTLPDDQVQPYRGVIRTNWLQGLEALLDSAHVTFLHSANLASERGRDYFKAESDYMLADGAPVFEFDARPYGFREGAIREEPGQRRYARVREVALPFFSFIPSAPTGPRIVCCSIPIDDVTTAQWYIPTIPTARSGPTCSARSECGRAIPIISTPTWAAPKTCGTRTARRWPTGTGAESPGAATPTKISRCRNRWVRSSIAARSTSALATG